MTRNKTFLLIYASTLLGILLWISAVFMAPLLESHSVPAGRLIYGIFSSVCHQVPSRCFYLFGHPLAVCTRCLGIYTGFLVGTLLFPCIKGFRTGNVPSVWLFISLTLPVAFDTAGNFFSIWNSPGWLRFIFGLIWGGVLPFYFLTGLDDFFVNLQKRKKKV